MKDRKVMNAPAMEYVKRLHALLYQSAALLGNVKQDWSSADLEVGLDVKYLEACRTLNNEIIELLDE